jgi:hypothetical protein
MNNGEQVRRGGADPLVAWEEISKLFNGLRDGIPTWPMVMNGVRSGLVNDHDDPPTTIGAACYVLSIDEGFLIVSAPQFNVILEINRKLQKNSKADFRILQFDYARNFRLVPSFLSIYHRHSVCHHPNFIDVQPPDATVVRRIIDLLKMGNVPLHPCQSLGFSSIIIILESWARRQLIPWSWSSPSQASASDASSTKSRGSRRIFDGSRSLVV